MSYGDGVVGSLKKEPTNPSPRFKKEGMND